MKSYFGKKGKKNVDRSRKIKFSSGTTKFPKEKLEGELSAENSLQDSTITAELSTRKGRRQLKIQEHEKRFENVEIKKAELINILTMTVRDPSKITEGMCKQLRKVFMPNSLTKLEMNTRMQDVIDVSDQLLITEIVYLSKDELKIAVMPKGPTFIFNIVEYDNNYKNFSMDLYREPALITMDGKWAHKNIFEGFGTRGGDSKRALHFHFKNDLIYIRHYYISTEDLEDKFKVGLKEIGPKLTLKLKKIEEGVFPEMNLKKSRNYSNNRREGSK